MTKQALTTTESLTNKQIRALRQEAGEAGDTVTVSICDVALATRPGQIAEIDESTRADLEIMGIVPEHVGADVAAREKVVEMISEVEANRLHDEAPKSGRQLQREIDAALSKR